MFMFGRLLIYKHRALVLLFYACARCVIMFFDSALKMD